MATIELTAKNFEETVENNDIVLVDFWADWCGPCRAFGPIFEQASERHSDLVFSKVDTEKEQELAAMFRVQSIPMLMIFREKVMVFAQPGMLPPPALEELITKVKGLDMDEVRQKIKEEEDKEKEGQKEE